MTDPNIRTSFAISMGDLENHVALSAESSREVRSSTAARDVLVAARKLIETPDKWVRDPYRNGWGDCHCTVTAIGEAITDIGYDVATEMAAEAAIKRAIGVDKMFSVMVWNDAPERTHAEVLAAFDKAIAECGA
jgi:hypothetical protein